MAPAALKHRHCCQNGWAWICTSLVLALLSPKGYAAEYWIKFGELVGVEQRQARVVRELREIPLKTHHASGAKYYFGFVLRSATSRPFHGYVVHRLPGKPKVWGGEIPSTGTELDEKTIRTERRLYANTWAHWVSFDPGDVAGRCLMEIWINGRLYKTIPYDVIPVR